MNLEECLLVSASLKKKQRLEDSSLASWVPEDEMCTDLELKAACCGRLLCISPCAAVSASCVSQLWKFDEMNHWLLKIPRAWVCLQSLVLMVGSTQGSSLRDAPASWLLAGSACNVRQLQLDWHSVSPCCLPCAGQLEGHCLPSAFVCPQERACWSTWRGGYSLPECRGEH